MIFDFDIILCIQSDNCFFFVILFQVNIEVDGKRDNIGIRVIGWRFLFSNLGNLDVVYSYVDIIIWLSSLGQ